MANRRKFLKTTGVIGTVGLAGCMGGGSSDDEETTTSSDTTEESGGDSTEATETTEEKMDFQNGEINFNVSPSVAQEKLQAQYQPIKEHLSNEFGVPAKLKLANNYSAVIQALGAGTSDMAETGPFAAALGVKADKANIALQRKGYGSWEYKSIIVAADEVDVSNLDEMKTYIENNDATIAFADRLSASGCLFPLYDLKKAGIEIGDLPEGGGGNAAFTPNFSSHTGAYETLKNGQADFAGMGGFVPGLQDDFEENATIINEHKGLPRAPIVVSPELTDEEQTALTEAFINAPDKIYLGENGEEGGDDDLWFDDVRKVSVDKYQPVIDAANELGVGTDYFK
ncbi:PhnD/SsuA/transferrin family substrate-binding protein [Halorussus caseinilyticus]|uniref:PhnD/SsuA/transferrin family substrate-binding protein n=1 Tax=Halorussus caseinilyticus TaxID=3034025 RepID=A0ABD5WSK2_9EURY|nr:PhnD/SsuA/transferrin family substrate-binding protein [Halorussus sp. DT72]